MVEHAPILAETTAIAERNAARAEGSLAPHGSPWQRAFDRLRRRRGARWAAAVLFCLCGAAIFAPLIASDLPYRIVAIDYGAYQSALRTLPAIANELAVRLERGSPSATNSQRDIAAQRDFARALESERGALELRLATLERHLVPADRAGPRELSAAADRAIRAAPGEDTAAREAAARELRERATGLARTHAARDPRQPDSGGRELVAVTSWPAFRALSGLEVGFMVLWIACLALWLPVWVRRASLQRREARAPRRPWIAPVALAVAAALLWSVFAPRETLSTSSAIKLGLTRGDVVASSVRFPPLAMGFAETHASESFRPPTWSSSSEIDASGRYVRGARAPGDLAPPAMPVEVRYGEPGRNSAWRHPLGTDRLGRDVLARLVHGARVSLAVGVSSAFVLLLLGLFFGALAGWFGGWIDFAISRAMEVLNSFPAFFLILCAAALVPQRTLHPLLAIVLVIAAVSWTGVARLVRAELLRLRELDFLLAARALGLRPARILWSHALPNAIAPVLVSASFAVSSGILVEAAVSFLGFGVRVPVPSWGAALAEAQGGEHAWLALFPGLALFLTVLCTNVLGEGLRDALDPREGGA